MYEFEFEPYSLCLFTHESINKSKTIKFYDYKSRQIVSIKLHKILFRGFEYLINRKFCNELNKSEQRYSLDKTLVGVHSYS